MIEENARKIKKIRREATGAPISLTEMLSKVFGQRDENKDEGGRMKGEEREAGGHEQAAGKTIRDFRFEISNCFSLPAPASASIFTFRLAFCFFFASV
ncbi:MAG TPA: hypothetical protein VF779_18125 [Pyrinomonadaceae bacterium]